MEFLGSHASDGSDDLGGVVDTFLDGLLSLDNENPINN